MQGDFKLPTNFTRSVIVALAVAVLCKSFIYKISVDPSAGLGLSDAYAACTGGACLMKGKPS